MSVSFEVLEQQIDSILEESISNDAYLFEKRKENLEKPELVKQVIDALKLGPSSATVVMILARKPKQKNGKTPARPKKNQLPEVEHQLPEVELINLWGRPNPLVCRKLCKKISWWK